MVGARIEVKGNAKFVYSSSCGEYWRLLLPGAYEVRAVGTRGLSSGWKPITVPTELSDEALRFDLVLDTVDATLFTAFVDYIPSLRTSLGEVFFIDE